MRVSRLLAFAVPMTYSISGRPANSATFFKGIDFDPPRAGMIPQTSDALSTLILEAGEVILDFRFARQQLVAGDRMTKQFLRVDFGEDPSDTDWSVAVET